MPRILFCLLCGLLASSFSEAQTAPGAANPTLLQTTFCDLIHNPAKYDGQWITVRARLALSFEDFSLSDADCPSTGVPGVWLTFGGDQDEIATYCCGSLTRKKGEEIEINGHEIPLVRDDSLRELLRLLQTQRLRRPDGQPCEANECAYYRSTTATLSGMFFTGQTTGMPGYGHLGCCHLLVIRQASVVSAKRTRVPAGGEFVCRKESWQPGGAEAATLDALLSCANSNDDDCDHDREMAFARLARHWNDKIDLPSGHHQGIDNVNGNWVQSWVSADLITQYSATQKEGASPKTISASRETCVPASAGLAPRPPSDKVYCTDRTRSWHDDTAAARRVDELMNKNKCAAADAEIAEAPRLILGSGDQSWRLTDLKNTASSVLHAQLQEWGIVPNSLRFDRCQDAATDEQKSRIVGCDWYSLDGMQTFTVLIRS